LLALVRNAQSAGSSSILMIFFHRRQPGALYRLLCGSTLRLLKNLPVRFNQEKSMVTSETSPQAEATAQFAQRLFCELQQAILQQESGALAGEVKAIHDMRVGIRRLRVALSNFAICLRKEDRQRLRVNLEHLARALGGARDLDVMIGALKSEQANKPDDNRAAINAFIGRLRARRRRRHQQLISYLQSEDFANFKREFRMSGESETVYNSSNEEAPQ
jgi:hypothetical protein